MPDLADVEAARTRLPFITSAGDTVSISGGVIYLNARPLPLLDVLDLSAALARAFNETVANHTTTNRKEAVRG
ncbi:MULTISPECIES: hypothetical protein [unclassified Micromonospora]|uniref:hypothetical protein n=1 Tax=unclassified Micromonospora TaxID=2617518 RepID=UPI00332F4D4A